MAVACCNLATVNMTMTVGERKRKIDKDDQNLICPSS